jgi:hypothetical protein
MDFDLLTHTHMPTGVSNRDITIQMAVNSYRPFYAVLDDMCSGVSFELFLSKASESELYDLAIRFLSQKAVGRDFIALDGGLNPSPAGKARRQFLVWCAHQTHSGGYIPFHRQMVSRFPQTQHLSINAKTAIFVAKCWFRSKPLPHSWDAVSRSIFRGIEGSNRNHAGKLFEKAVRSAAEIAAFATDPDIEIAPVETTVVNGSAKTRVDVVAQKGDQLRLIQCKFSQLASPSHQQVIMRDLRDAMNQLQIVHEHALVIIGGSDWGRHLGQMQLNVIWDPDPIPASQDWIEDIADKIIASRIFTKM